MSVKLTALFLLVVTLMADLSWCKKYEHRNPWYQPRFENKLDSPFHPRFQQQQQQQQHEQQQHKDYILRRDDILLQGEQLSPEQAPKRDPHRYRPLPLPLRDAIRYVKLYGKHADMLKRLDSPSSSATDELEIKIHQHRSSKMQCKKTPRTKDCKIDVNGCGSGFTEDVPLPYRDVMTPSCNKHDVCYDCGFTRGWIKEECDNTFLEDMDNACLCKYPNFIDFVAYKGCRYTAYLMWAAVDTFGGQYFGKVVKDFCKNDCVLAYGSPNERVLY